MNIYGDRGFASYKDTMKFDEAFYKVTNKLEVLAASEKRADAIEAGKQMIKMLLQPETDDDYFPGYNIQLIREIIIPLEQMMNCNTIDNSLFSQI